jgi:uncharacterized protein YukE
MSSQVFVNPEEIDVFISEIRLFLDTLNNSTNRLNNAFEHLSSSWQDRKRAEFEEQYRELLRVLKVFENSSEENIAHLTMLSQRAKDYLGS